MQLKSFYLTTNENPFVEKFDTPIAKIEGVLIGKDNNKCSLLLTLRKTVFIEEKTKRTSVVNFMDFPALRLSGKKTSTKEATVEYRGAYRKCVDNIRIVFPSAAVLRQFAKLFAKCAKVANENPEQSFLSDKERSVRLGEECAAAKVPLTVKLLFVSVSAARNFLAYKRAAGIFFFPRRLFTNNEAYVACLCRSLLDVFQLYTDFAYKALSLEDFGCLVCWLSGCDAKEVADSGVYSKTIEPTTPTGFLKAFKCCVFKKKYTTQVLSDRVYIFETQLGFALQTHATFGVTPTEFSQRCKVSIEFSYAYFQICLSSGLLVCEKEGKEEKFFLFERLTALKENALELLKQARV